MSSSLDQWLRRERVYEATIVAEVLCLVLALACFALPFELMALPARAYAKTKEGHIVLSLAANQHARGLLIAGVALLGLTLVAELARRRMKQSRDQEVA
jgi:hypothetical protein